MGKVVIYCLHYCTCTNSISVCNWYSPFFAFLYKKMYLLRCDRDGGGIKLTHSSVMQWFSRCNFYVFSFPFSLPISRVDFIDVSQCIPKCLCSIWISIRLIFNAHRCESSNNRAFLSPKSKFITNSRFLCHHLRSVCVACQAPNPNVTTVWQMLKAATHVLGGHVCILYVWIVREGLFIAFILFAVVEKRKNGTKLLLLYGRVAKTKRPSNNFACVKTN